MAVHKHVNDTAANDGLVLSYFKLVLKNRSLDAIVNSGITHQKRQISEKGDRLLRSKHCLIWSMYCRVISQFLDICSFMWNAAFQWYQLVSILSVFFSKFSHICHWCLYYWYREQSQGRTRQPAALHLPDGPVGPPARWAATSNGEVGQAT